MIFGFPPIIRKYQFYCVSYMCFDVTEAIGSHAPKYLLVDCTASTTPSKLFPVGYKFNVETDQKHFEHKIYIEMYIHF